MNKLLLLASLASLLCACADDPWSDANADADDVVAIDWGSFDGLLPDDENAFRMRAILVNSNRYALTTWYEVEEDFDAQDGEHLDLGGTDEHDIRPVASEAFALAVSLRLGTYDADMTGVSIDDAEQIAIRLLGSVAASHRSNTDDGWGGGWQTALWAAYAGTAGWLLWDALSPDDAGNVARMVQSEAQRLVGYQVPYFRDSNDAILSSGDSKAEENAWNAQLLYLAVNMMPDHAQAPAWEYKAAELAVSSYARPDDLVAARRVNGRPLAQWLHGSNANADGMVINHDIVHPDYIVTASYTASAPLWYGMRRQPTPSAMFAGTAAAYAALSEVVWEPWSTYSGTSCVISTCNCDDSLLCEASDPGGTIYVPGSADIYFPHGNDWGSGRRMNFAMFDALAHDFQLDTNLAVKARSWEAVHAQAVLDQQFESSDRRAYTTDDADIYQGREEWVAVHAAMAWFSKYVAAQGAYARTDRFIDVVIHEGDREFSVDEGRARWVPRLPEGDYTVHASASAGAVYEVTHAGGTTRVEVDAGGDGEPWIPLGTFHFEGTAEVAGATAAGGIRFERTAVHGAIPAVSRRP